MHSYFTATQSHPQQNPSVLHVGENKSLSTHIADYMPTFPDSHTYLKTLVSYQYEINKF